MVDDWGLRIHTVNSALCEVGYGPEIVTLRADLRRVSAQFYSISGLGC